MKFRGKFAIAFFSASVAFLAFSGLMITNNWFTSRAQQPINNPGAQIRIFESVLQHIQNDYVDAPDLNKVRFGALRGMADGLDPYSSYLTAEQVRAYQTEKASKTEFGIGAEFSQVSSYLYIISVVKGSPADKAGLMPGDVVEYIDTKATRDISLYDAKQLIRGTPGSKVKLRVLRTGERPQTIEVTRGGYEIPKASSEVKSGNIGVIKVYSLEKGEGRDIRGQVEALKNKGVQKIVLDLRNVATGDLAEAVEVANLFIKDGELAKVVGRENKIVNTFTADPAKHLFDGQVAALIDLGTAGAGEVVASAILERKRGEVIGEQSFGAGSDQELFSLRGGDGLLLTTSKWASVSGTPFLSDKRTTSGVKPSIEVKRPETPEPIEVEELVEQKEEEDVENPETDPETDEPVKPAPKPQKSQEDIQLNKALEILSGKAKAAAGGK
jgi:carboxyl-terminal processing protease